MRNARSRCIRGAHLAALACLFAAGVPTATSYGQDTAGLRARPGRRPIKLWPPDDTPSSERDQGIGRTIELAGWRYRAVKSPQPRGGVPWELIVTPAAEKTKGWRRGPAGRQPLPLAAISRKSQGPRNDPQSIPTVEIPDVLWKQWMAPDLQDVVGIHFHEFVTDDLARILFTVHKVPPDGPDGKPPPPGSYHGRAGSRIEATLLAPMTFCLDQTVVARKDPLDKELVGRRARHEAGHAQLSGRVFLEVLRGPQDWNTEYCQGRRSHLAYYWKREQIGRSWDGYRGRVGKLLTLRTSVVVVPPTRWSMLLPIPPQRVTQEHIQALNDVVVKLAPWFAHVDQQAQARYHAQHGKFEQASRP